MNKLFNLMSLCVCISLE